MYEFIVRFDGKYVACALQCFVPINRGILCLEKPSNAILNEFLLEVHRTRSGGIVPYLLTPDYNSMNSSMPPKICLLFFE